MSKITKADALQLVDEILQILKHLEGIVGKFISLRDPGVTSRGPRVHDCFL